MKEFNWIEELKEKSLKYDCHGNHDNFRVFGFKGDINRYLRHSEKFNGEERIFNSLADRKLEWQRHLDASILIYTMYSGSLNWNSLYRNSKGVYFKKGTDKFYIKE
jgi:hypothetical protein